MHRRCLASISLFVLVAALMGLNGCRGHGSASVNNGTGTVIIHLTDAPLDLSEVQSVNVTITGVIVYPAESFEGMALATQTSPIPLMTHPETFDLLTLTDGATDLLASGEVPAGDYSRIRLQISEAHLVYLDESTAALKIEPHKVDIPIHFSVSSGEETGMTLDFDAAASVQVNETGSGQLILRPVVTPVS